MKNDLIIGNESTSVLTQENDWIVGMLEDIFKQYKKHVYEYFIKESIDRREYESSISSIADILEEQLKSRFGFSLKIYHDKTFAITPLFNTHDFAMVGKNTLKSSAKHNLEIIRDYLKDNNIKIDFKKACITKIPKTITIHLLLDMNSILHITAREFASIIIHEIGHVFTLLEIYEHSTYTNITLLNAFLDNISTRSHTSIGGLNKKFKNIIYEYESHQKHIEKLIDKINLDALDNKDTDAEMLADSFVTKFGLGVELSEVLVKLNEVFNVVDIMKLTSLFLLTVSVAFFGIMNSIFLLSIPSLMGGVAIFLGTLILLGLAKLVFYLNKHSSNNPVNTQHGDLLSRIRYIKTNVNKEIRAGNIQSKKILKGLVKQSMTISDIIKDIEESSENSILTDIMLSVTTNFNNGDMYKLKMLEVINNDLHVVKNLLK